MSVNLDLSRSRRLMTLLLVTALAFAHGCSDDGGGDDAPGVGCLSFSGETGPADGTVNAAESGGSCSTVEIELTITTVTDLFSVSFSAVYDPALVDLVGVSTTGSILASDGTNLNVLVTQMDDQVAIGITRQGSTGIDVTGSQLLLTLEFSRAAPAGAGMLTFEGESVLGSETPPQVKPGILWSGGSLQVR
jgi:hypothetical protein